MTILERQSAFQRNMQAVSIVNNNQHLELKPFLRSCHQQFKDIFAKCPHHFVKTFCCLSVYFKRYPTADTEIIERSNLTTTSLILNSAQYIGDLYVDYFEDRLLSKLSKFQERESGWELFKIIDLTVNINKHSPIVGGGGGGGATNNINAPQFVIGKHSPTNFVHNDNLSFKWAVLAALHDIKLKNTEGLPKYLPKYNLLKYDFISFPVAITDVWKFEYQNEMSINVFTYQRKPHSSYKLIPIYVTRRKQTKHINLLLVNKLGISKTDHNHYCAIKNLPEFIGSVITHPECICDRRLIHSPPFNGLNAHIKQCGLENKSKVELPSKDDSRIQFEHFKYPNLKRFTIYAHIVYISTTTSQSTTVGGNQIPASIGYYLKDRKNPDLCFYDSHRGQDCVKWFCGQLEVIAKIIWASIVPFTPLTEEQESAYKTTNICHVCLETIDSECRVNKKCKDRCPITWEYRGAAHRNCCADWRDTYTIAVVFHDLSCYHSHLIMLEMNKIAGGEATLLPINDNRHISFMKTCSNPDMEWFQFIRFRFIDSFRFMASPLDTLSSQLHPLQMEIVKSEMANCNDDQLKLARKNIAYPHEYIDSWSKFDDESLPLKKQFFCNVTAKHISKADCVHAKLVWQTFNIQNLGEYADLHLKINVLHLADVFETFRKTVHNQYRLDPAHYITAANLSWDAMLKYTKAKIELLTDMEQMLFVERGMRDDVSQCSHRHANANHKYMGDDYDDSKPDNYLIQLDVNHLHESAMMECLPMSGFEWMTTDIKFNISSIPDDNPEGYFLEVDLECHASIHDNHADYPMCPERKTPPGSKFSKLMLTLENKSKYIIHYRNLKQAIKYGVVLKKIHRVLKFHQSRWMKPYIQSNLKRHETTTNPFEKNIFKILNTAVYMKTIDNARKHIDVKLCSEWQGKNGAKSLVGSPFFKSSSILGESWAQIELFKTVSVLIVPISIGVAIQDISKYLLYDFHYGYMKPAFENKLQLMYSDVNSFIYRILDQDVFASEHYSILLNKCNAATQLMTIANENSIITEYVGIKSKMFGIRHKTLKKGRPPKRLTFNNTINFKNYLHCLNTTCNLINPHNSILSKLQKNHNRKTQNTPPSPATQTPYDDTRHLVSNSVQTLPWGHYSILKHKTK